MISVALVFFALLLARRPASLGSINAWGAPLQRPLTAATIATASWLRGVAQAVTNPSRIVDLERQHATLRAREAELLVQLREKDALLAAMSGTTRLQDATHAASTVRVVAGTFSAASAQLVVIRNRDTLLALGDPVLAHGALIGRIAEVGEARAVVRLLRDERSRIAVALAGGTGAPIGIVEPALGGGHALTHIPIDVAMVQDASVVTAATDEQIPAGIPVGTVSEVRVAPGGFFQRAALVTFADPRAETFVTVLHVTNNE
ncbi:MAG: rod shape-determining protein MreC [bacterium]|nr:rod shape-determining protein MreC [bacterium]